MTSLRSLTGHRSARRRSDVVRNERRVIEAATRLLANDPQATMSEIAEAAELTRATLYRYYASREDLITAIETAAETEIAALVARLPKRGPVVPALVDLLDDSVTLGTRYRYLVLFPRELTVSPVIARAQDDFAGFVARGQRRGEIDRAFDPHVVAHLFLGLVTSALVPVALGRVTQPAAVEQVGRALTKMLAAPTATADRSE